MALDFFAGCIGGCAGVLVGHPFDTVKVRLQTQSTTKPLYSGTINCFKEIIRQESMLGLYKGMASPLYGLMAINAIVFGVQGNVQRRMNNPDSLLTHFTAGGIAGFAQSIICSPMELAKTRMQIQGQGESRYKFTHTKHDYTGPVDCLVKIYHTEGIPGVFRGFGLTVVRETPSFAVYFATYEYLCRSWKQGEKASTTVLLMAGGFTGMASWLVTYPIDVVKSRIQADMTGKYSGFWDCCVKSYNAEGPIFLTKGLSSTMLRAFPVNAATFGAVEMTFRLAKRTHISGEDDTYDWATYQSEFHPPSSDSHLHVIPNFPSHP